MCNLDKDQGLTAEILKRLVRYEPETGQMFWLIGQRKGQECGTRMVKGYVRIEFTAIFGRFGFLRHRLAWLYMTGEWPEDQVDHRNLVKGDDRWENLRAATNDQNQANRGLRPHNTSGITGVSYHPSQGKWYAELSIGGVRVLHAYFASQAQAVEARSNALRHHGEFAVRLPVGEKL